MSIGPGAQIGAFTVLGLIGQGGMGKVYRARDGRLKRDVALKMLPDDLASQPDRLARCQREAEILASLTHQNVAAVHGLEDKGGVRALVMELVEGPTLADRIARGPIPVDEALPIARQIAEALDYAHERGVVQRDLKPANIKGHARAELGGGAEAARPGEMMPTELEFALRSGALASRAAFAPTPRSRTARHLGANWRCGSIWGKSGPVGHPLP